MKTLRCSFCGRDEAQVAKLVAGPRVFICDRCVTQAARIMDQHPLDDSIAGPYARRRSRRPRVQEWWRWLLSRRRPLERQIASA